MHSELTARGAAHDLRHLLCTIRLSAELLENTGSQDITRHTQRILRAVDRGADICGTIVEKGLPAAPAQIGIRGVLRDVADQVSVPKGVALAIDCPDDLSVAVDAGALFRSVFNLASNALDAVTGIKGAKVQLRGRRLDNRLILTVEDNGPGLAANKRKNTRANPHAPKSAGLGLKIVGTLAEEMGGYLRLIRSSSDGTVFAVILPMDGQPLKKPAQLGDPNPTDLLCG